jgi:hypothetical protein
MKQSFHLLKLEEPLSCGGTQRRKLWSPDLSCAPELWSASCICANIKKLHFAFKEGQVLEFSNLSIELQEACLCSELIKFILNSDKCSKREIPVADWFGQWTDLDFMACQHGCYDVED